MRREPSGRSGLARECSGGSAPKNENGRPSSRPHVIARYLRSMWKARDYRPALRWRTIKRGSMLSHDLPADALHGDHRNSGRFIDALHLPAHHTAAIVEPDDIVLTIASGIKHGHRRPRRVHRRHQLRLLRHPRRHVPDHAGRSVAPQDVMTAITVEITDQRRRPSGTQRAETPHVDRRGLKQLPHDRRAGRWIEPQKVLDAVAVEIAEPGELIVRRHRADHFDVAHAETVHDPRRDDTTVGAEHEIVLAIAIQITDRNQRPSRRDRTDDCAARDRRPVHQPHDDGAAGLDPHDVGLAVAVQITRTGDIPRRTDGGDRGVADDRVVLDAPQRVRAERRQAPEQPAVVYAGEVALAAVEVAEIEDARAADAKYPRRGHDIGSRGRGRPGFAWALALTAPSAHEAVGADKVRLNSRG